MSAILLKWLLTFLCTVCLHIVVWRIHRPLHYRVWVPALLGIFVVGGGLAAAVLVAALTLPGDAVVGGPVVEWCAIALLQTAVGIVYTFGYTLLLVGSPSLLILERLATAPAGLRVDDVGLPMTADDLVGLRVDDLTRSGMITLDARARQLTAKGRRLTAWVLFYRHLVGLPDGEGG
jgi:hypothetical protein